ncbi:alanine symporter family protein [Ehrlichia chaffeensis str. Heartland]|uniref:Sodium:alanine symporter family protein n=1 Tax=Ehrlichia chaffeensis (strain ATCC CRL-10679 / Arkansas) TaxID=205920 RepID=Q2GH27_EHRCR|nr:alanine:cation symporter family protein [Ehrlichia chaffeensis]ABD44978.1 sodium:alanine symporter family protein [Ehrlichia chaffeensis str. Arkansas]AHX03538.1 alanine symporter family protein [Ehrlichia chaffeensis str. Heartland]AHX08033.1 alanine symporter family protein [Ehrlichia chaffeensis str. Osceola]AHX08077.1 alanine symporter family protein [Ehrlichia chaffeensis str. Saint Vincent]AHX09113.1 alanine symporter family protein [Ehrlichia chaffeensis str. Wakulla]
MSILNLVLSFPAVFLLLFTGIYLSIKSKFLQITKLPSAISLITMKKYRDKSFSIGALCTIIGGNLGVGNISGTAVALKSGGPGFALWMIIIVTLCSIIKYVTCYLSIETRVKVNKQYIGGPAIYFKNAFKSKKAVIVFTILMLICSIAIGNFVQVNSLSIPMELINKPPIIAGLFMCAMFFAVTILRLEIITALISRLVPGMAIAYIILASFVLYKFNDNIIPSIKLMFANFLTFDSFKSGMIGAFILETFHIIQVGTFRGIFATDIGLGLEGMVHSSINSNSKNFNTHQSMISLISPFIVVIVTLVTTLVILVTNAWSGPLESTNMCIAAFKSAFDSEYINYVIILIMFCFSFTTVFTWFVCAKSTLYCLTDGKDSLLIKMWKILYTIIIPIGALGKVQLLWDIADISISLILISNTIAILILLPKYKNIFKV